MKKKRPRKRKRSQRSRKSAKPRSPASGMTARQGDSSARIFGSENLDHRPSIGMSMFSIDPLMPPIPLE